MSSLISRALHLPQVHVRNIALFYLLSAATSAFFISGNWIFFWTRFMSYSQLGIVDASCFAFGMFMEVPTGAVSDLIGKKKTIIAALALSLIGGLLVSTTTGITQLVIGFLIVLAGWAFYSGAAEAFAYDSLVELKLEKHFDEVISTSSVISTLVMIATTVIGIWLYEVNFRLPHLFWALTYGFGLVAAYWIVEPKIDTIHFSFKNYFEQLKKGAQQLSQPALKPFLWLLVALLGMYFIFSYGLIKPALFTSFGWQAVEQGWVMAGLSILGAALNRAIPWMRKHWSDKTGLVILTVLLGMGFILSSVLQNWWGLLAVTILVIGGHMGTPWSSIVINREIESKYRATTLSTLAMITKIPYILTAIVAGVMIDAGKLPVFSIILGTITLLSLFSLTVNKVSKN